MKTLIKHLNHQPSVSFTAHLEQQLHTFSEIRQIDEARVTLEHRLEASPAFRVGAAWSPGPDLTCEAVDHTLPAALAKAVTMLHAKIEDRGANRSRRARESAGTGGTATQRETRC